MKLTLPKKIGWIIFSLLLFLDAFLDVVRGAEGNPLWKPVVARFGINIVLFLVPLLLFLFYLVVKAGGWLIAKVDKLPYAEEFVLTGLVIVYFIYDLWVVSVDFFGFRLIQNFQKMTPFLMAVGLAYALLAQWLMKSRVET
ncbi:MAG: hypothetical protein FJ044_00410, partial [Candidatus Cloacimonetes bacterium]|nr:hypothetical protein [Candidatus Cloacimonadota bacterium]